MVTVFVFQVDDVNADENVSSAQIVGELDSKGSVQTPIAGSTCPVLSPNAEQWNQNSGFPAPKKKRSSLAPKNLTDSLIVSTSIEHGKMVFCFNKGGNKQNCK